MADPMAGGSAAEATAAGGRRRIKPRALKTVLAEQGIPRHWLGGNGVATALANGVNLLFPAGERFFVRSVRRYLPQLTDQGLVAQVHGFGGQEGRHAQAHERFFDVMRGHGYELGRFLKLYDFACYKLIEPLSPAVVRLASTAACEHFTAIMAEGALRYPVLERAHPAMQELLRWHAAEEIEHKAVAFDVLQEVDPSYALRVAGLLIAASLLGAFWLSATAMLLWQDHRDGVLDLGEDLRRLQEWQQANGRRGLLREVFVHGIREYLRRDFHPSQSGSDPLAEAYLRGAGIL
jgi:hypothetical protein